jgi:hypothetical protein
MDCVDVRDRLTEYALSLLPADDVDRVERHLSWCAGCRKEAAELAGGAATVALSLPDAEPPAELEGRIVREIRTATAGPRRPRGRGRSRTIVLVAATLAILMGLGWVSTLGRLQTAKQAQEDSRRRAQSTVEGFEKLSKDLLAGTQAPGPRDRLLDAQLVPELGYDGGGKALVFLSPRRPDWILVYVGGVAARGGPYGVTFQSPSGEVIPLGKQSADMGGGITMFGQYPRSLKSFTRIVVTDRRGHVVMTGTVEDVEAHPTTVG